MTPVTNFDPLGAHGRHRHHDGDLLAQGAHIDHRYMMESEILGHLGVLRDIVDVLILSEPDTKFDDHVFSLRVRVDGG